MTTRSHAIAALVFAAVIMTLGVPLSASDETTSRRFLDRNQEGFFWYVDPAEETLEEIEPPPTPAPSTLSAAPEGPPPYSTAWLKEYLPKYLDAAIDNPTPENVSAYLYLQQYTLEKASIFTDAVEQVTYGNPVLDGNNQRPIATFANNAVLDRTNDRRNELLHELSTKMGIFYFVDQSKLSEAQNEVINIFKRNYNFSGVTISFKSPTPFAEDQRPDIGHSELMGITTVPAIVVASGDGRYDVISQAPISLPELSRRLFVAAKRLQVIDDEVLDSLKPIANKSNITITAVEDGTLTTPIPPKEIIQMFNGAK